MTTGKEIMKKIKIQTECYNMLGSIMSTLIDNIELDKEIASKMSFDGTIWTNISTAKSLIGEDISRLGTILDNAEIDIDL